MAIQTDIDGVTVECDTPSGEVRPGEEVEIGVDIDNSNPGTQIEYTAVLSVGGEFVQRFQGSLTPGIAIESATVTLDDPGEYDVNVEVDVEAVGGI